MRNLMSEDSNKQQLMLFCNRVCADGVRSRIVNSQMKKLDNVFFAEKHVYPKIQRGKNKTGQIVMIKFLTDLLKGKRRDVKR